MPAEFAFSPKVINEILERLDTISERLENISKRLELLEMLVYTKEKRGRFLKDLQYIKNSRYRERLFYLIDGTKNSNDLAKELGISPVHVRNIIKDINKRFFYIENRTVHVKKSNKISKKRAYFLTYAGRILLELLEESKNGPIEKLI